MQRRDYLAGMSLTAISVFAGCSSGESSGNGTNASTDTNTATAGSKSTTTETATATSTISSPTTDEGGLPDSPSGDGTPGTPTGEFTTSADTTPMDADPFVKTLEGRLGEKNLMTAYAINTREDEQTVELTYVASEENQRKRLEAFAESFVETAKRAGGTGGWELDMTVQTGAERNVWYTWTVKDKWAVQRLSGEISREKFYSKIEGTTTTPTTTS